jgi:hypothetical protein
MRLFEGELREFGLLENAEASDALSALFQGSTDAGTAPSQGMALEKTSR